jgi:hypothetical protein
MNASQWHVVAASVQGTAHRKLNLPCQDAHAAEVLPGGLVLLAVADGAGSAARSQEGAQLAVSETLKALARSLATRPPADERGWQDVLRSAFLHTRGCLAALAAASAAPLQQFATTLTCAVATHEWLAVGRIGDGAVIIELRDGEMIASSAPIKGEYANETVFLTMDDAPARLEVQAMREPARALMLISDGLIRLALKLPDYAPHLPFFQPLVAFASNASDAAGANTQLADFLSSERVNARTDDDKTLVLAVRVQTGELARPGARLEVSAP